jgi:hypothetical protein
MELKYDDTLGAIPVEGGHVSGVGKIIGLFGDEQDVFTGNADKLAIGSVAWDAASSELKAMARHNAEQVGKCNSVFFS